MRGPKWRSLNFTRTLGPGLVTGAADDDPSGIATYSQVGAKFGFSLAWIMPFSYPLMSVTQAIAARIGSVTGCGIAQNLRQHYPRWVLFGAVLILLLANTVNLGADLGAMGDACRMLAGGPMLAYTAAFALVSALLQMYLSYRRYAAILKFLTLSLFTYVAVVFSVGVPWTHALAGTFIPSFVFEASFAQAVIAVLGTTISPYLFFWQASQEVEEQNRRRVDLANAAPKKAKREIGRIRLDTWAGMGFSNLVSLFIIIATGATLHAKGITNIDTSEQAAEALRPIAGELTFALFAAGIIGTGMLAVPVLAASAAYAVCEAFGLASSLDRKPKNAPAFYGVIGAAMATGFLLNFIGLNPIKALYWTAILNGVLAAPLMAVMLFIASNKKIMGEHTLPPVLRAAGWFATAVMASAAIAFFIV